MSAVSDMKLQLFSKQYYDFVHEFVKSDFEDTKVLGKFYTDWTIAESMIDDLLACFVLPEDCSELRVIDPFCGDGRLVQLLLDKMGKSNKYNGLTVNVVLWDIDNSAVITAKEALSKVKTELHSLNILIDAKKTDAFVYYSNEEESFDICVTNPPWGLLKPQKLFNERCKPEEIEEYKTAIAIYDDYMRAEFPLSQPTKKFGRWGTNLGRTGTEVALRLIKKTGLCGIVSPASLFNDQVSVPLRQWIFEKHHILAVSYYPAELKLYGTADVSSVTAVLGCGETRHDFCIKIYNTERSCVERRLTVEEYEYIKRNQYSLPLESGLNTMDILLRLEKMSSLAEVCEKNNLKFTRELDETRVAEKLVSSGKIFFAKGYMVDRYSFAPEDMFLNENVFEAPISVSKWKIVWRDVSRNSQKRRMKATILPPGHIAGNSLGVLYAEKLEDVDALKILLAVMNSMVFEFQARSQLVSNHVSSGVIKQIRVPTLTLNEELLLAVERQLSGNDVNPILEAIVAKMYGLTYEQFMLIVSGFDYDNDELLQLQKAATEVLGKEPHSLIYNHYAAKLSDLDMQIVKCVPPGGNWKNIPEDIPSQRLVQIRESYNAGKGSRSTYYGRLRPDMPSYTINTYFNRPGNGCNMHYAQDRTLSQREAARLQTFPDSFEFKGSLNAINNQIGNAVPVLLAYQIAKQIPFKGQFIDLFCGAGGLALGFIWAGWKPIIANDIDKYAIETHRANIGESAICGDINSEEVYEAIVKAATIAKDENPELPLFVIGGPPCQGFSTANTRRGAEDMRNWLFKAYVKIVRAIQPYGFVFENVTGITNLDGGRFFEMIKSELETCVDTIKVNRVNAADYGIPQRRERVIILGGPSALVDPFALLPITAVYRNGQLGLLPQVIGVEDALGDLPPIEQSQDGSNLEYLHAAATPFQRFIRGEISPQDYLDSYK